jgi:hypothetical protein
MDSGPSSHGGEDKLTKNEPTVEKMREMDDEDLLEWIQRKKPKMLRDKVLENFKEKYVDGDIFLDHAGDWKFFEEKCNLPIGPSEGLAKLASVVMGKDTIGTKSKSYPFMSCSSRRGETPANNQAAHGKRKGKTIFNVAYRQPANNITADGAPESPISPKRNRREDIWLELAATANEQRKFIREQITSINNEHSNSVDVPNPLPRTVDDKLSDRQPNSDQQSNLDEQSNPDKRSNSVDPAYPLPGAVDKLSDPAFQCKLSFPFIRIVPVRFNIGRTAKREWNYMGRTKFKELLHELMYVRESDNYTVWLYGTQGYGKSHLLAALVCYLAAQDERVVYIPHCRQLLEDPVGYLQTAMLFAWADDITTQKIIMTLNTEDQVKDFFNSPKVKNAIFVVDQLNGMNDDLEEGKRLKRWLIRCASRFKKVFSSSANYVDYLKQPRRQNSPRVLHVYGGLTGVSHLKISLIKIYVEMRFLTRLDGNGPVVGAT